MHKRVGIILGALALSLFFSARCEPAGLREAFRQTAFQAEYAQEGVDILCRWDYAPAVWIGGDETRDDRAGLEEFVAQIREKVPALAEMSVTPWHFEADIRIYLVKLEEIREYVPGYVEGNWGFFNYWYDDGGVMLEADVGVATDVTDQTQRDHLIREELVGSLGLPSDVGDHPDSILYGPWTTTRELSDLDWALLNLVYDGRLTAGMSWEEARGALGW